MQLTLAQLADRLDIELRGDGSVCISSVATLQHAGRGALSFLANPGYRKYLANTRASAVIVAEQDAGQVSVAALISENPYRSYARAASVICPPSPGQAGVHPSAVLDEDVSLGPGVWVGPHCYIEKGVHIGAGVQIGPGCHLGAGVRLGAGSQLISRVTVLAAAAVGERVLLHPGVVIGGEGFGLAQHQGQWEKVPQLGSVHIGNDVEIGANTSIDRGAIEDTVIENGVKIDNQVQIGHNVFIGAHSALAGCVGVSGSARIGRYCTLAGGVGLVGHIELADDVHVTGMSLVTRSIGRAGTYSAGTPLMENRLWLRNAVRIKQLDEVVERIAAIEKRLAGQGES